MHDFHDSVNKKLDFIQKQVKAIKTQNSNNEASEIKNTVKELEKSIDIKLKNLEEKFCTKVDIQKDDLNKNITTFADAVSNNIEKQKKGV